MAEDKVTREEAFLHQQAITENKMGEMVCWLLMQLLEMEKKSNAKIPEWSDAHIERISVWWKMMVQRKKLPQKCVEMDIDDLMSQRAARVQSTQNMRGGQAMGTKEDNAVRRPPDESTHVLATEPAVRRRASVGGSHLQSNLSRTSSFPAVRKHPEQGQGRGVAMRERSGSIPSSLMTGQGRASLSAQYLTTNSSPRSCVLPETLGTKTNRRNAGRSLHRLVVPEEENDCFVGSCSANNLPRTASRASPMASPTYSEGWPSPHLASSSSSTSPVQPSSLRRSQSFIRTPISRTGSGDSTHLMPKQVSPESEVGPARRVPDAGNEAAKVCDRSSPPSYTHLCFC